VLQRRRASRQRLLEVQLTALLHCLEIREIFSRRGTWPNSSNPEIDYRASRPEQRKEAIVRIASLRGSEWSNQMYHW